MSLVDLHVHSTYSDGLMTVDRLVDHAMAAGLSGMALTDHDTLDGLEEALRVIDNHHQYGIEEFYFVAGCEFSTWHPVLGEVHMLGYFSDRRYTELEGLLHQYRDSRKKRAHKIADCLKTQGYPVEIESLAGGENFPVGRMHIARELVRKGYFLETQQAFDRLLRPGTPCFFPRKEIGTFDVIASIRSVGGTPVLAHPTFLYDGNNWKYVEEMYLKGLAGIETGHPKISRDLASKIEIYSKGRFVFTGGSDYHGENGRDEMGRYGIELDNVRKMFLSLKAVAP
jgi:hypothetical protein